MPLRARTVADHHAGRRQPDQGQHRGPVNVSVSTGGQHAARRQHGGLVVARPELQLQRDQARHRRARCVDLGDCRHGQRHGGLRRHLGRRADGGGRGGDAACRPFPTRSPGRGQGTADELGRDERSSPTRPRSPACWRRSPASAAGEVRVDRALALDDRGAGMRTSLTGSLSFGYYSATDEPHAHASKVTVRNYGAGGTHVIRSRRASATPTTPRAARSRSRLRHRLGARQRQRDLQRAAALDASKLPAWTLNGGSRAATARCCRRSSSTAT